jgi:alpha-aminoadipate carrier protein LysW
LSRTSFFELPWLSCYKEGQEVEMPVCPVCDAIVHLPEGVLAHELLDCNECSTELEITSLEPPLLREAPLEAEDWGE